MSFPQFAFNNIRRNARAYIAFYLSSAFMVMIFFAYSVFINHPSVSSAKMGSNAAAGMSVASYIVYIFAFFFVLFSISAFLKSRNHEFGILTILGARPGQINRLVFMENMLIGALSIITGVAAGMLLSKLFLLLSTRIMGMEELPFYWPVRALYVTAGLFMALFVVISVFTLLFIRKNRVLELLTGTRKPKKEPKVSWLLALLCIALLGTGYWAIRQPLELQWIVIAAVTGIAGTYLFFSQLSVLTIRLLKLSRRRVWRRTNLIWISEMAYKLKDNARMLFMVTVVTSLACMATGFLLSINAQSREAYLKSPFAFMYTVYEPLKTKADLEPIRSRLESEGVKYEEAKASLLRIYGGTKDGKILPDLISISEYNRLAELAGVETKVAPAEGQGIMVYNLNKPSDTLSFAQGEQLSYKDLGVTLEIADITNLKTDLFNQYTTYLLVLSDGQFHDLHAKTAKAYPEALTDRYMIKVPEWDGVLPDSEGKNGVLSTALTDEAIQKSKQTNDYSTGLSARAASYLATKQGTAMIGFNGSFIALIFSISSASFLYFRLHSELAEDRRVYRSLSKIGLSTGEMSAASTRQIAVLFFVPILVAWIQTLVVIRPVLNQMHIYRVTVPVLITIGGFLTLQTLYFIIVRTRYVRSLNKAMV
ncbi:ABC transporter permease [Shouchella clausii]